MVKEKDLCHVKKKKTVILFDCVSDEIHNAHLIL